MSGNSCASLGGSCEKFAAAQLLGAVWSWCLYGVLVVQFYVYSYNFSQDNRYIKILVYSVFFLETVQTVLSGADLYYWFAAGFGNPKHLNLPFAAAFDLPIIGSAVSLSVQFFFVYRIFKLSKKRSRWLCVTICLFSVIGASGAFVGGVFSYIGYDRMEGPLLDFVQLTWFMGNTLSDTLIASAMFYHLRKICSRGGNLSRHILGSIVRLTVETNLATTTARIVALLIARLYPDRNWYVCPIYIIEKLYSNTLLVSLNNRISIRDTCEAVGVVVDSQAVTSFESSARPSSTMDIIVLEPENPQEVCMNGPVAEAEVEERVNTPATIDIV